MILAGNPASPRGINSEGLRRRGFSSSTIAAIKRAYRTLYRRGLPLEDARKEIAALVGEYPEVELFSSFLAVSGRGIVR